MEESPPNKEASVTSAGRRANLARRVAVGVIAIPLMSWLAWVGGLPFVVLVAAIVILGLLEFYRMAEARGRPLVWLGVVCGAGLCLAAWLGASQVALTILVPVVLVAALFFRARDEALGAVAVTLLGLLWVGWLGSHLILVRELPQAEGGAYGAGGRYVWLVFILTWSSDTAAYGAGLVWGRHRLYERVSPKKSIEGALGGVVACVALGWIARAWFAPFLDGTDVLALGIGVGVVSQLGDLVESMIKRDIGVKDASRLIPGHGGILDRFDSMFLSAPVVYLYLRFAVIE